MRKIKEICKKAVAALEVAAMAVALITGLSVADIQSVSAATSGKLTLNAGTNVVSDGDAVTYSFVAPESGVYYFFTEGAAYDTYGTLSVGEEKYTDDDSGCGANFAINMWLEKGETCEVAVREYSEDYFECTLYVCDEINAGNHVAGLTYAEGGEGYDYADLGKSFTLSVELLSIAGTTMNQLPEGYSVKWYKSNDEETIDLNRSGLSYTISSVTEANLCTPENDNLYYYASLYCGENESVSLFYQLYDKEACLNVEIYNTLYASVGDSITLAPCATDYYGNEVDLNGEAYNIVWYVYKPYESEEPAYIGEGNSYEIASVSEADFCTEASPVSYFCVINDTNYAMFLILDKEYAYTASSISLYSEVGESLTLEAELYDYEDNAADLSGEEFTFAWYKISSSDYDGEYGEVIGTSATYDIEQVDETDIRDFSDNIYVCKIYKNDIWVADYQVEILSRSQYIMAKNSSYTVSVGESVTLTPELEDYYGEKIDINDENLEFTWYKWNGYRETVLGKGSTYTVAGVSESDFYDENTESGSYYIYEVRHAGSEQVNWGCIYLYKKSAGTNTKPDTPSTPSNNTRIM